MNVVKTLTGANRGFAPVFAVILSACVGCGSDIDRDDVAGNATFAGQPIVYGTVDFVPDTSKGHSGPAGTAEIVDGKYDTALGGQGIVPGPHLVRVTAYEQRPMGLDDETLPVLPGLATAPLFFNYPIEADVAGGTYDFDVPEEAGGTDSSKSAPVESNAP